MTMPRIVVLLLILNTLVVLGGTAANYMLIRGLSAPSASDPAAEEEAGEVEIKEYGFFSVPKIIVTLKGAQREHYFVLDVVLQTEIDVDQDKLTLLDPLVRNSVVASLAELDYATLRNMPIAQLQSRLESALIADFAGKSLERLFKHVLVSKLIVQ